MKGPMDVLIVFLGIWWLALVPGVFFFITFDVIKEWIEEKVRELRRKS